MRVIDHPLYNTWKTMHARCSNKNRAEYFYYGARGITVCEDWDDFWTFVKDMGERPAGASLDRIDNDGPYCASNCRWANQSEQNRNSRKTRYIEVDGQSLCMKDWAAKLSVHPSAISHASKKHGAVEAIRRMLSKHHSSNV